MSTTTTIKGGHTDPKNEWFWKVGCLGITSACSATCEGSFVAAVKVETDKGTANEEAFKNCISETEFAKLNGCEVTCAPTLKMMKTSEAVVVEKYSISAWGPG